MIFYRIFELILATLIQRYDQNFIPFQERETNWNFTGFQVPHFMIVLIPHINLLNLSYIIKYLFLRTMEPLRAILFTLLIMSNILFSLNIIICGSVIKFVRRFCFFLIICLFGLVLNYTNRYCWYTHWYKLCPIYCRFVSVLTLCCPFLKKSGQYYWSISVNVSIFGLLTK